MSIFTKINFAYLTLVLLKDYYFWRFFFKNFKISFLIQHQHYNSNIIKNFLLKKLCKGKTFLIQKNINTINSNGFFYDCFGIFTFSKKVAIKKKKSCSNIKKIYPVGSLFMEKSLINYSKKNIEKIDLLYLGGNKLNPNGYYDSYSSYSKDYATVLGWLKKFSKDNEHLNIVYKDHSNKKKNDHFERNFLLNSNVKFISKSIDSYHLALESKFICSWASTMIIELTACKKFSFFLDPGGRNDQFLQGIDEKKLISICSYRDLINIYNYATRAGFINNDKKKIFNETSNSTSEKIYKIINNYK